MSLVWNPNRFFDTAWYVQRNPDVAEKSMNPLDHFYVFGAVEGRNPSPRFDTTWYLATNDDVWSSGINPLLHYLRFGAAEGRAPRFADGTETRQTVAQTSEGRR